MCLTQKPDAKGRCRREVIILHRGEAATAGGFMVAVREDFQFAVKGVNKKDCNYLIQTLKTEKLVWEAQIIHFARDRA